MENRKAVLFYLDSEMHRKAKIESAVRGVSLSRLIREAVTEELRKSDSLRAVTPYDNQ